jgi:ERCC4-type nuclease
MENENGVKLQLIIDYRESDLIKLFEEKKETTIGFKVENLPIGDIVIKNNEEILFIIERKSINDLCASITDGRFREQKQRLFESIGDTNKIMYIIEGSKAKISKFSRITKTTVDSAILNLMLKHNYKVMSSENLNDTLDVILNLYNKCLKGEISKGENTVQFTQNMEMPKLIKKADKLNDHVFINQLGVIQGVSVNIATKIQESGYKSIGDLVIAFTKSEKPETLLSDIKISDKKKVGVALSKKIYNKIMGK